jgi:hypothetical protein
MFKRGCNALSLMIFALIGCGVMAFGGYLIGVDAPQKRAEAREIEGLRGLDPARYNQVTLGTRVAITGRLYDNPTLSGQVHPITRYELVAYARDIWWVTRDSDGNENGSWSNYEQELPPLQMRFGDEILQMGGNLEGVTIAGFPYEFLEPTSGGLNDTYNGQSLSDDSVRIRGFKNNDVVTIVGIKAEGGVITSERLHGGDRAALVEYLMGEASNQRNGGLAALAVGAIFFAVGFFGSLYSLLRG